MEFNSGFKGLTLLPTQFRSSSNR